jgi:hypothetical protein
VIVIKAIAECLDHGEIIELGPTSVEVCTSLDWYICYVGAAYPPTPPIALGDR